MAHLKFKPSKLTLFVSLLLFGSIMLLMPQAITSKLNFAFINVFSFFLNIGAASPTSTRVIPKNSSDFVSRQEYNKLWVAYSNLQAQLLEQKKQIEKISRIRMTEPDESTALVLAGVVNRRKGELIINRGSADNIKKGQYVLGDSAVIGYIDQVADDVASVRLITNSTCKMHIKISAPDVNSYINGTMQGDDKNAAKILNVPRKYKVKEGYYVYAAPKPGVLQSPRIIGRISKCIPDDANPLLWNITVKPAYDLDNINDVAVIVIRQSLD